MFDVGDDIVDMLDPDRQAHIAWGNAGQKLIFRRKLAVSGACGMDGKAPRVTDIGDMVEELEVVDELFPCLDAGKFKPQQCARPTRQITVSQSLFPSLLQ